MKKPVRPLTTLIVFLVFFAVIGVLGSLNAKPNNSVATMPAASSPANVASTNPVPVSTPSSMVQDTSVQTYTPPPAGYVKKDMTAEVQSTLPDELSYLVTKAEETEPGRIVVNTDIVDPRGKNGSPQAMEAISICQAIVPMGYEHVRIMEKDGTHYVLYGHPHVPAGECGEV